MLNLGDDWLNGNSLFLVFVLLREEKIALDFLSPNAKRFLANTFSRYNVV
jgi:hypothetical protein